MLRPYETVADLWTMRRFLHRGWQFAGPNCGLYHPGDLSWQRALISPDVFPADGRIVLWERPDGEIAGYGWHYEKSSELLISVDPSLAGMPEWDRIANDLLTWGEGRFAGSTTAGFSTLALESDQQMISFLAGHGYAPIREHRMHSLEFDLAAGVPEPVLPEGYRIIAMTEDADLDERVRLHAEVWVPPRFTRDVYRRVRTSPGYDPTLDLVAVAPDGTYAAYAICWHSELLGNGEFEPVGTREAFRGRGLAKAVLHEALGRLIERGCRKGYVYSYEESVPACRLYLSAGFRVINNWVNLEKLA